MLSLRIVALAALMGALQRAPIDGTWELARIFRSGPAPSTRAVPIDSTVYLRVTLESHTGGWISGRLYRRYFGIEEHSRIEGGPLGGTGRYIIGADLDHPAPAQARTAAWFAGGESDTLRFGTPFVPDADSIELRRVAPDAPYPPTVTVVVAGR